MSKRNRAISFLILLILSLIGCSPEPDTLTSTPDPPSTGLEYRANSESQPGFEDYDPADTSPNLHVPAEADPRPGNAQPEPMWLYLPGVMHEVLEVEITDQETTIPIVEPPAPDESETTPAGCPEGCTVYVPGCDIKGNISFTSGEKIYHVPGGEYYPQTEIAPDFGERWFCTEEEAVANGWRKSKR